MTPEEHRKRHADLQQALDELVADWIRHTDKLPSKSPVLDLMKWSNDQSTKCPDHDAVSE